MVLVLKSIPLPKRRDEGPEGRPVLGGDVTGVAVGLARGQGWRRG